WKELVARLRLLSDGRCQCHVQIDRDVRSSPQRLRERLILLRDGTERDASVAQHPTDLIVLVGERSHDRVELNEYGVDLWLVLLVHVRQRIEVLHHRLELRQDALYVAGSLVEGSVECL